MKILIVDDDHDIREIMMFTYDNEVDAEYVYAGDGEEAIAELKKDPSIDLVVCDYNMPISNGGRVYTYLIENNLNIPYVFCSSESINDHHEFGDRRLVISEVKKPNIFDGVSDSILAYDRFVQVNKTNCECTKKKKSEHCHVNLAILKVCEKLPCDIFIKIGDEKLLKIFNAGEELVPTDIEKYEDKLLQFFLFEKKYMKLFLEEVSKKIDNIMDDRHKNQPEKVLDIHAVILSTVRHLGFCDRIIKVTERSVQYILGVVDNNNDYAELYHNIFGHEGKYLTKHSVALAYITTALVSRSQWDSFDTKNKLVLASFFHDMIINNDDFDETNNKDLLSFKNHPFETAEMIKKMKGIPPDLDRIILDHHERPDGSGFPRGLTASQIPTLSALFIFSHDIVDIICTLGNNGEKINRESIKAQLNLDLYSSGTFKKCLDIFDKIVIFSEDEL